MSKETTLRTSDLSQFTGTEQWYQHGINRAVLFTDGAKYEAPEKKKKQECFALQLIMRFHVSI